MGLALALAMRFVALDIESTGVDPRKDRIIEMHMRQVEWPLLRTLWSATYSFDPEMPIPPEATLVNGLTDEMVKDCAPFRYYAQHLRSRLSDDCVVIAYNGRRFDVPLLHHEFIRAGVPGLEPNLPIIDPYEIFLQDYPRTLTGAVKQYLKRDHAKAHNAEADVDAMIMILGTQLLSHPAPDVLEAALTPDHVRLDFGGCFYRDGEGVIRFGFGKHRDKPAASHPEYLKWMLRRDFDEEAKKCAKECLDCTPAAA